MESSAEVARRNQLLDAARAVIGKRGLADTTMDDFADELGITPDELRAYFDSKVDLVVALIAQNRERQRAMFVELAKNPKLTNMQRDRAAWQFFVAHEDDMRIFFEAFGLALGDEPSREFLIGVADWLPMLVQSYTARGYSNERATSMATLAIATIRGLLFDLCGTQQRARVNAAMELWLSLASTD